MFGLVWNGILKCVKAFLFTRRLSSKSLIKIGGAPTFKPKARVVGHLHLASDVGSILQQVMLMLLTMVHAIIQEGLHVEGSFGCLKSCGYQRAR